MRLPLRCDAGFGSRSRMSSLIVRGDALQAADRHGLRLRFVLAVLGRAFLDAAAAARRLARPVARAPEDSREHVRLPVDEVRVAVAARRDQPDVFGDGSVGRAGPLTIDDFVEIVGVRDIGRLQSLCSPVARPAVFLSRRCPRSKQELRPDRGRCRDATPAVGAWKAPPTGCSPTACGRPASLLQCASPKPHEQVRPLGSVEVAEFGVDQPRPGGKRPAAHDAMVAEPGRGVVGIGVGGESRGTDRTARPSIPRHCRRAARAPGRAPGVRRRRAPPPHGPGGRPQRRGERPWRRTPTRPRSAADVPPTGSTPPLRRH